MFAALEPDATAAPAKAVKVRRQVKVFRIIAAAYMFSWQCDDIQITGFSIYNLGGRKEK